MLNGADIWFRVAPGAIVVEWNIHDPSGEQGVAGMWDTHFRYVSAQNTNLILADVLHSFAL